MDERMTTLPAHLLAPALDAVLNISPAAIVMVAETQQILLFSQGAETIFGFSKEEVLGKPLDILLPAATAEIHRQHVMNFAQAPESVRLMNARQIVWGRRKDGKIFPAEAAISKSSQPGATIFTVFLHDISARVRLEETLRESQQNFEALRTKHASSGPLTEQALLTEVEACLRYTEIWGQQIENLMRANTELSQFAGVLSHDLQAPLRGIVSLLDLLKKTWEVGDREKGQEYLDLIQADATRLATLIRNLLDAARPHAQSHQFPPVSLEEVLVEALQNLSVAIQENAVKITHEALPTLLVNKSQMVQLFQNLIENAIKHRSEQPPAIHLSVQYFPGVVSSLDIPSENVSPAHWVFCVQDNGIGIEPQNYERVFEIYQQFPANNKPGYGMGLAIARRVVEHHGGQIWVESEIGQGAKFYFLLPASNTISPFPVATSL